MVSVFGGDTRYPSTRAGLGESVSAGGIRDILSLNFVDRKETVVFSGSPRSDMTYLVRALGRKAERQGRSVLIVEVVALLLRLMERSGEHLSEKDERHPRNVGLLIVENFGTQKLSPRQMDRFARLMAARLDRAPTVITSPSLLNQWVSRMEGSNEGKELFQRLLRKASQVVIGDEGEKIEKSLR